MVKNKQYTHLVNENANFLPTIQNENIISRVVKSTSSTPTPPTPTPTPTQFIRIIDSGGNDNGISIVCDGIGNVYGVGYYTGTATIVNHIGVTLATLPSSVNQAGILVKFSNTGNFLYAKVIDSAGNDSIEHVVCDSNNDVYVVGSYVGTATVVSNPDGNTNYTFPASSNSAGFLIKFQSNGQFVFARTFDASNNDYAYGVACDTLNNVYVIGTYNGSLIIKDNNYTQIASLPASTSGTDAGYVSKFSSSGTYLYSITVDGAGNDGGYTVTCDSSNNMFFGGIFNSAPATVYFINSSNQVSTLSSLNNGVQSGFIIKFNSSGGFLWSRYLYNFGVRLNTYGVYINCIACDSTQNVYIVGNYVSIPTINNGPDGAVITTLIDAGGFRSCAYIVKFNSSGAVLGGRNLTGPNPWSGGRSAFKIDFSGNLLWAGSHDKTDGLIFRNINGTILNYLPNSDNTILGYFIKLDLNMNYLMYRNVQNTTALTNEVGNGITCDTDNNIIICGYYRGSSSLRDDTNSIIVNLPTVVNDGGFIIKMSSTGIL